ncbi:MAG: hypothetical protein AAGH15_02350 [Myxococcota bacterium]
MSRTLRLLTATGLMLGGMLPACECTTGTLAGSGRACTADTDCPASEVCADERCVPNRPDDTPPGCVDPDMDGYGPLCGLTADDPRNEDCDPDDPTQTGVEVCDGRDNDCDDLVDDGVLSPCGDCDPSCSASGIGPGAGTPDAPGFDPTDDNSDGVGLDPEGAIVLDAERINTNFIWIANTTEGTVSRFSTEAPYPELGRYSTGPADFRMNTPRPTGNGFFGNDPSRTSVNSFGDAFVANREGNDIVYISALGTGCLDTNGDGEITTSTDVNGDAIIERSEVLAFGEDDCVVRQSLDEAFPGEDRVRAAAAQDVTGPDGEVRRFIWVGAYNTTPADGGGCGECAGGVAKYEVVESADGNVRLERRLVTSAPVRPYGFALDGDGRLWIATRDGDLLGFVDTEVCVDDASCAVRGCTASGTEGGECDDAVKGRIPAPFTPYGITVDFNQRVWIGGDEIGRYDLGAAPGSRWTVVDVPRSGIAVHGIAADAAGWIWGAAQGDGVYRVDADDPARWTTVADTAGPLHKGMAVDAEGKIWSITQGRSGDAETSDAEAVVIVPGPTLEDATVQRDVADSIYNPYTYSDMTGLQLRLATNPRGTYEHVVEGCDPETTSDGLTRWAELRFEAETPAGTSVAFRVKTADTRAGLVDAPFVAVGLTPPDASPLDLSMALADALADGTIDAVGRFLLVEVALEANRSSSVEVITPRVTGLDVTFTCPPIFG